MAKKVFVTSSETAPIKQDLHDRLTQLGLEVVRLSPNQPIESIPFNEASALILPGDDCDIHPSRYGESIRSPRVQLNSSREDFEYKVLPLALQQEMPILGLCWGFQLLNVYFGGSLYQNLPDEFESVIEHEQNADSKTPTHWVKFDPQGEFHAQFQCNDLFVNSTHHQGIKTLGSGLFPEALAEDGLVEAFRHTEHPCLWAVEWHPERLSDDPVLGAFEKQLKSG